MNVKKFTAPSSREALRKVREALGEDAVILSNRSVNGLVEILAMDDSSLGAMAEKSAQSTQVAKSSSVMMEQKAHSDEPQFTPSGVGGIASNSRQFGLSQHVPQPETEITSIATVGQAELAQMMNEIRSMRGMLENKISEISWLNTQQRSPHKAEILKEMLATGFSASLSRFLIEKLPEGDSQVQGLAWIKAILSKNLCTISNESELLEKGGVYALVGPTGVGKTTTTAKLAARCVMRHGPSKLALITTDGYRIGGYEQLRIYGKILGVMVHSVKDESDLRIALAELKNKHTVLIDTVGVSQRDKMVAEQVAMLSGAGTEVKRLLCLNATSTGETLSEVVRAYQGKDLTGCILTKLDEAATIGGALDVAIRQKLNIYYVASGQRVPEDLHVVNKQYLVDRAFKLKRETLAYKYQNEELPLLMANLSPMSLEKATARSEVALG
ncbi:MAG: flagellar biosynthesis protein FlhF [Undibacterium sp.]|nr:flagellar biosynthesis protein FlhF [Undibacterium sp.]